MQDFFLDYNNPYLFFQDKNSLSNERKKYILYGCIGNVGTTGGNIIQGEEVKVDYPVDFFIKNLELFKNVPVDINHKYCKSNNPNDIVGKVIDVFFNTKEEGYVTDNGNKVPRDNLPHCKVEVNLTEEEFANATGFSTAFFPFYEDIDEANGHKDIIKRITGIDRNKPISLSITVGIKPRIDSCNAIYNSQNLPSENENENNFKKKLDINFESVNNELTNMSEEEIKALKDENEALKAKIAELESKKDETVVNSEEGAKVEENPIPANETNTDKIEDVKEMTISESADKIINEVKASISELANVITSALKTANNNVVENACDNKDAVMNSKTFSLKINSIYDK